MDKEVLRKRIDAIDIACTATLAGDPDNQWIIEEGYLTFPARRIQELVKLARIGLEHANGEH